jgi:putative redox protein
MVNENWMVIIDKTNLGGKMAQTTVSWVEGKRFIGVDSTNHSVVLSTADEGVGMKPSDMLLVALSACSSVDVVDILRKKRIELKKLEVQASAEQDKEPPWTFRKIHLKYILAGEGLTNKDIEQAITLSQEKYCSVAATVRGVAEITWEYVLEGDQELN